MVGKKLNPLWQDPVIEAPPSNGRWIYAATMEVPAGTMVLLTVTVKDRPSNVTTHQVEETV